MSKEFKTTIGLEIHVQLKTRAKMFCRCNNSAEGKAPNTLVCPVCLGLPGSLPVADKQAIEWTIKTGLALGARIARIAKFDRKHYFYPDLPKNYQISQFDEPFARGGELKLKTQNSKLKINEEITIRFNRIHLEEDAGKLIHSNGQSLVDLNRAGTPLMEIVTEPDIISPKMAADFLRRLQRLVRDEAQVSDADMEKGNLRCDANISIRCQNSIRQPAEKCPMSEIVEIKNLNSFRFVEKALAIEEARLRADYANWPKAKTKVTRGYDSRRNITFVQRQKEESADYRYFPEPDLPPIDTSQFNLNRLKKEIGQSFETRLAELTLVKVPKFEASVLASNWPKFKTYDILNYSFPTTAEKIYLPTLAKAIVHNYFGFELSNEGDVAMSGEYAKAIRDLHNGLISKPLFCSIVNLIYQKSYSYDQARRDLLAATELDKAAVLSIIDNVLASNQKEARRYQAGEQKLFGFFIGEVRRKLGGRGEAKMIAEILKEKLER